MYLCEVVDLRHAGYSVARAILMTGGGVWCEPSLLKGSYRTLCPSSSDSIIHYNRTLHYTFGVGRSETFQRRAGEGPAVPDAGGRERAEARRALGLVERFDIEPFPDFSAK